MIKELIKIKENNDIVSIFCDEDDTSMFLEGYIYAIGRQDFLIKHITPVSYTHLTLPTICSV